MSGGFGAPATRQNLLATSRQLDRVARGTGLLRRKREALVTELFRLARPAASLRRAITARADTAWPLLHDALGSDGAAGLRALGWPARELGVEVRAGQVWGIAVADITSRAPVRRTLEARAMPPGSVSPGAIGTAEAFEELTDLLLEAAGREGLLRRLGEALQRTSRQVNALEQRLGPGLASRVASIRRTLDEREREERVRLERLLRRRSGTG